MDLYQAELKAGVKVTANVAKGRFIAQSGGYATAGGMAAGVSLFGSNIGEMATVVYGGSALLELEEAVTKDQEIMAGTDGKGKIATNSSVFPLATVVQAVALEDGAIGDLIEVRLTQYKI